MNEKIDTVIIGAGHAGLFETVKITGDWRLVNFDIRFVFCRKPFDRANG